MKNSIEKITSLFAKILNNFTGQSNTTDQLVENLTILPESIRYAMNYRDAQLSKEEITSLLDPRFGVVGIYMIMKYFNEQVEHQKEIMKQICTYTNDHATLYKKLSDYLQVQPATHTVSGGKIAILNKRNFNGLDENFTHITNEINQGEQTPIILLYAGLLGLPTLLNEYKGDTIRLFNPKKSGESFRLSKDAHGWNVSSEQMDIQANNYVFVDDIHKHGETYAQAMEKIRTLGYTDTIPLYSAVDMRTE